MENEKCLEMISLLNAHIVPILMGTYNKKIKLVMNRTCRLREALCELRISNDGPDWIAGRTSVNQRQLTIVYGRDIGAFSITVS